MTELETECQRILGAAMIRDSGLRYYLLPRFWDKTSLEGRGCEEFVLQGKAEWLQYPNNFAPGILIHG